MKSSHRSKVTEYVISVDPRVGNDLVLVMWWDFYWNTLNRHVLDDFKRYLGENGGFIHPMHCF